MKRMSWGLFEVGNSQEEKAMRQIPSAGLVDEPAQGRRLTAR